MKIQRKTYTLACVHTRGISVNSLVRKFVSTAAYESKEFDSEDVWAGRVQSLESHPSLWWTRSIVLKLAFIIKCTSDGVYVPCIYTHAR